ncbi:MAG TPA: helix-turn-helix domain-containing protein [Terriglobia bacterium]|nr:helix-turn-helix domain-containing protein [Terriglobia bacterium]
MAELDVSKVIRRVRQKLQVSQEGLSRLLNATKGAVQHWERGRNRPDLARLMALRQLCPPSQERKDLDSLIRESQAQVSPYSSIKTGLRNQAAKNKDLEELFPPQGLDVLRKENQRLQRQVSKLQSVLDRKTQQVQILEELAKDLQSQIASLQAGVAGASPTASQQAPKPAGQ